MKSKLMTKLVLAAAVACAAVGGAQATILHWLIDSVDGLTQKNRYMAYVFKSSGELSGYGDTTLEKACSLLMGGSTLSAADGLIYSGSNGGKSGWVNGDNQITVSAGKFSVFAVLFDSTDVKTANNYMPVQNNATGSSRNASDTDTTKYIETNNGGSDFQYISWGPQKDVSWTPVATIPEPTSGVLLLVGVAALALRRKKAT